MLAEHTLNHALERVVSSTCMKHIHPLLQRGSDVDHDAVRRIVSEHGPAAGFRYRWQQEALTSAITAHCTLVTRLDKDIPWKTLILIQQRQSEIAQIVDELDRSRARDVRRWWFTMIEVIFQLKKGNPGGPVTIGPLTRVHIAWQTFSSKTAFK